MHHRGIPQFSESLDVFLRWYWLIVGQAVRLDKKEDREIRFPDPLCIPDLQAVGY